MSDGVDLSHSHTSLQVTDASCSQWHIVYISFKGPICKQIDFWVSLPTGPILTDSDSGMWADPTRLTVTQDVALRDKLQMSLMDFWLQIYVFNRVSTSSNKSQLDSSQTCFTLTCKWEQTVSLRFSEELNICCTLSFFNTSCLFFAVFVFNHVFMKSPASPPPR